MGNRTTASRNSRVLRVNEGKVGQLECMFNSLSVSNELWAILVVDTGPKSGANLPYLQPSNAKPVHTFVDLPFHREASLFLFLVSNPGTNPTCYTEASAKSYPLCERFRHIRDRAPCCRFVCLAGNSGGPIALEMVGPWVFKFTKINALFTPL